MISLPKKINHNFLFTCVFLLSSLASASSDIPIEATVIFNTTCARCHEGGCSGRMSFHLPEEAANQHILRHGGILTQERIQQLFKLLRYMKEECSFYPLPVALISDQIWGREMLNKFQSPSKQAYFMPLGLLETGKYQLLFEELGNANFCVEVINDEFDFIDLDRENSKKTLKFHVEERSEFFLRLKAQQTITLIKIELTKE